MTWNNVQDIIKFKQQVTKQVAQQDPVTVRYTKNRNNDIYSTAYVSTQTESI